MFRFVISGAVTVTVSALVLIGIATQGNPPDPHVRLADRASTIATGQPGSNIEGIRSTLTPIVVREMVKQSMQAQVAAAEAEAERRAAEIAEEADSSPAQQPGPASSADSSWDGTGTPCAIPQYICDRESGGDPTVYNTEGSGASGKYQFMHDTWDGYGGYENAADAPESVQDAKARELWADGAGCSHWSAC